MAKKYRFPQVKCHAHWFPDFVSLVVRNCCIPRSKVSSASFFVFFLHSVASDLGQHCLLRPDCPNTEGNSLLKQSFLCVIIS